MTDKGDILILIGLGYLAVKFLNLGKVQRERTKLHRYYPGDMDVPDITEYGRELRQRFKLHRYYPGD